MICTFGDTTDVTWWRELDLPVRAVVGRDGRLPAEPPAAARRPTPAGAAYAELAGQDRQAGPAPHRRAAAARRATCVGEPRPITHPVKFYEKGDRPARDRHQPPVVHPQRRPRRRRCAQALLERGEELRLAPAVHAARYENWVEGLNGDWLISRQRFFGVPFPVWYPRRRRRRAVDHDDPIVPDEADAARRPVVRRARRATPRTSGASPAASSATPTSWTRGPRRRSRPRSPAAGRTTPTCSPAPSRWTCGPQAHEIIRTWLFSTVVRAHFEHGALPWTRRRHLGLDPRPRPQEDVEVEGQRRHAHGRCSSSTAPTPSATGRPAAGPGTDTAFDDGQMKVGRRLAIKVLNASRSSSSACGEAGARRRRASPSRSTGPCWPGWPTWSTRPPPPSRTTTTPGPSSAPRRSSGRSATTTSSWSRAGPTAAGRRGRRRRPAPRCAVALSTLLRLFAPFLPFVTEEVWSWWQDGLGPPGAVADAAELGAGRRRRPARPRRRRRRPRRGPQGQDRGEARRCGPTSTGSWCVDTPERLAGPRSRRATSRAPGGSSVAASLELAPRSRPTVSVGGQPDAGGVGAGLALGRGATAMRCGKRDLDALLVERLLDARTAAPAAPSTGRPAWSSRTRRMAMPSGAEALDAPHLGLLEDRGAHHLVVPDLVGRRLDDPRRPRRRSVS